MAELKILVEFIVAVVSAYFLIRIENVKQQKDITQLQLRVGKLEEKTELHEKDVREDLQEIKEMIHDLQLKLVQQNRRQIDK
jgi:hypothetical protein